jgi:Glycosyl transferases, related to UDP-glucuronosyltransferase
VIPEVDLFIHHGGNNSFNEALYFGKPAIIMPYCWDGLDNAARITDTGYGADLPRYKWTDRARLDHRAAAGGQENGQAPPGPLAPYAEGQGHRQGRGSDSESDGESSMSSSSAPHIKEAAKAAGSPNGARSPMPSRVSHLQRKAALEAGRGGRARGGGRSLGLHPRLLAALAPGDELCYFLGGRATYTEHNGETIEIGPGTVVHFPSGWTGRCDVEATLRNTYMLVRAPTAIDRGAAPILGVRKWPARSRIGGPCRP